MCVERLHTVSKELATIFLDVSRENENLTDRFLLSAWGTLTARMHSLLTETVVRSLAHSDFTPEEIITSNRPVTVFMRWKEQDLLALSPLVRLLWGSLIDELVAIYDSRAGSGCQPVMLLIDEAGRTAIPSLADHATTVVGRGISIWLAVQSLSQLEVVYGKARAQVLRDNMESQLYYRPTDVATARYVEERCGRQSAYAHQSTAQQNGHTSEGRSEQAVPLLSAHDFLRYKDHEIIGFHRALPPPQAASHGLETAPPTSEAKNCTTTEVTHPCKPCRSADAARVRPICIHRPRPLGPGNTRTCPGGHPARHTGLEGLQATIKFNWTSIAPTFRTPPCLEPL